MTSVVGLFEQRTNAETLAGQLLATGMAADRLKLQDASTPAADLVENSPRDKTRSGALFFTLLGGLIFAIFGVAAALGVISASAAPTSIAIAIIVVFVLIGLFCGVFLGFVKALADAEQSLQVFRDGLQHGNAMLIVRAEKAQVKRIAEMMRQRHALAVQASSQLRPMSLPAAPEEMIGAPAH